MPSARLTRRLMEFGYKAAVRFSNEYRISHYNLGLAEGGAEDMCGSQARMVARLLGDTRIDATTVLLDVGAGIGGALNQLARAHRPRLAVGLELCWPNIQSYMRRRGANGSTGRVDFIQGDAQVLPLANGSVDVLLNLESAFHYPDKDRFLQESFRVIRPGGRLLIGDLVQERWIPRMMSVSQGAWFWNEPRYRSQLATAGFRVVSSEDVSAGVIHSIAGAIRQIRRGGFGRWVAAFQSVAGIWGAGLMLRRRRLRYMLFRAEK